MASIRLSPADRNALHPLASRRREVPDDGGRVTAAEDELSAAKRAVRGLAAGRARRDGKQHQTEEDMDAHADILPRRESVRHLRPDSWP